MADEEVRISSSMDGELEAALERLHQRLSGVEDKLEDVRRAGRRAGAGVDEGMDEAARSTDRAKRAAEGAAPPIRRAGDAAAKSGAKAAAAGAGWDRFADKMEKAGRKAGGVGSILAVYKWAGIATAIFALAGGVSALGAGAAIAVGGLAPMVGVLAAIPPLLLLTKLSMLAVHLAATQLEDPLTRIKNQFTELGPTIAQGGLLSGMNAFANSLGGLSKVTGTGLAGLGGELGLAARNIGEIVKSRPFLDQVAAIFAGLRPILANVLAGLIAIARTLLNFIQAALPMTHAMSQTFLDIANDLLAWSAQMLANGKLAAWLMRAWDLFRRAVGVLVDVLIGLFNIFRIGAGYATGMGFSLEESARQFRYWSASAEGQQRINRYFADSLPALHEMARFLGIIGGAFGHLAANQNIAPLLAQINDQLLPALGRLISSFVGTGGLGPAIITALTAMANFLAQLDSSALTDFALAVAAVVNGVIWISQHVPGAAQAISLLATAFLAFKLLGPVFSIVAGGARAFAWISAASAMTGELSLMQKLMGGIFLPTLRMVGRGFVSMAATGIRALISLSVALVTTPIGWIILGIMAIIAVLILLWIKCAWFRNAVKAVWNAVKIAFWAVVEALKIAWFATMNALRTAVHAVAGFFVGLWQGLVSVVSAIWHGLVVAWQAVWSVLEPIVRVIFNIIRVIVQINIYVIMALITLVAIIAEAAFHAIVAAARWAWFTIIKPIFEAVAEVASAIWAAVSTAAKLAWDAIVAVVSWFWNTILMPIFTGIQVSGNAVWSVISTAAQVCWNIISTAVSWLYSNILLPIFSGIQVAGNAVWSPIATAASVAWETIKAVWGAVSGFFSGVFDAVGTAGSKIWEGVSSAASTAASLVKGAWDAVVGAVKAVWNAIANVWNGIPSVTVPDWVPFIGGKSFSLPKMPVLYAGGPAPAGPALVGEHGPEMVVRGKQIIGMVGQQGPTIAQLPRGSYVVPNLRTVLAGMAKPIPAPVAAAVAASAPSYAAAGASRDPELSRAVRALARAVHDQRPPIAIAGGADTERAVLAALRTHDRERRARDRYDYVAGRG